MARAVYHDADIALLDDCLSAVDAHVGRDLFDECIVKALLGRDSRKIPSKKKKTVILVTNALQYLSHPMVDRIVVLEQGAVVESGSYEELSSREDSKFQQLLGAFKNTLSGNYGNKSTPQPNAVDDFDESEVSELDSSKRNSVRLSLVQQPDEMKKQQLMSDEMAEREIGKVDREVYLTWMNAAGGIWVIPAVLLVYALGEAATIFSNWWLTHWSHAADVSRSSQLYFLGIYGIINVCAIFALFFRQVVVILFGIRASKKVRIDISQSQSKYYVLIPFFLPIQLFILLLDSTLKAPMSFFDTTPAGRIMNRFSKGEFGLVIGPYLD